MKGHRLAPLALAAVLACSGCQGGARTRRVAAAPEPILNDPGTSSASVVEAQPARAVTFADRHPLFTKPREYYESSGNNKVVKAAAATVIGIPAGIVGEMKQIVVGQPPAPAY